MRICLVGFNNLFLMPYMNYYCRLLDNQGIAYEIIYWDRCGLEEQCKEGVYAYRWRVRTLMDKTLGIFGFRHFAREILRCRDYDRVIVLTTLPAVLLEDILRYKYRGRYLVDIRDYTYEHLKMYYKRLQQLVSNSALNVISSPDFCKFLPTGDYVLCHNISFNKNGNREIRRINPRQVNRIRIAYIGSIGYYDQLQAIADAVGNDPRFSLEFFGDGPASGAIRRYCREKGYLNVTFHGRYQPEQKEGFYREVDLLFNLYGNSSQLVRYALSNKLYDAAWYYVPILVSPGTTMEKESQGFSISIDLYEQGVADRIAMKYYAINWQSFEYRCDDFVERVMQDNSLFEKRFWRFLGIGE